MKNLLSLHNQISDEELGMFNIKPGTTQVVDQTVAVQLS